MPITEAIQRIIMANGTSIDIAAQAKKEGVNDLRRSGLLKVKQGLTSLAEILGSTNE
jgi:type IV pilus assembly protein PilB